MTRWRGGWPRDRQRQARQPDSSAALAANAFGWFLDRLCLLPPFREFADFDWQALRGSGYGLAHFISASPPTIIAAAISRTGVADSPSITTPSTNAPTAPIPVQIV